MKLHNLFENSTDIQSVIRDALTAGASDWRKTTIRKHRLIVQTAYEAPGMLTKNNNYIITDVPALSLEQFHQLYKTSFKEHTNSNIYSSNRSKTVEGWDDGGFLRILNVPLPSSAMTWNRSKKIQAITWKEFVNMVEADWPIGNDTYDDDFDE